ncbi:MAG: hypothetical protein ACRYG8_19855 [Janthinobacterium lividum]
MWLADKEFMQKTNKIFHVVDEDGDWYSNLVATIYHVPFIEVSTISDSIFTLPETDRGIPEPPSGAGLKTNVIAQRLSNAIIRDLIAHDGMSIVSGHHDIPATSPYPSKVSNAPKLPRTLLTDNNCS